MTEIDYQLKMARNHIAAFLEVTDPGFREIYDSVKAFSMCPVERLYDLYKAVRYVDAAGIPGDIVEVGVWRGGALMLAALSSIGEMGRICVGFDTFSGHLEPQSDEVDIWGNDLHERWRVETGGGVLAWASVSAAEVFDALDGVGIEASRIELIEGDVKETVAAWQDRDIAILRIGCDWYPESLATLQGLYPFLVQGGVLICDDYGHHSGQRRAVDEFFAGETIRFTHVDYSCITSLRLDTPGSQLSSPSSTGHGLPMRVGTNDQHASSSLKLPQFELPWRQ